MARSRPTEMNFADAGFEDATRPSAVTSRSVPSAYFAIARNCWVAWAPLSVAWAGTVRRDTIFAAGQAALAIRRNANRSLTAFASPSRKLFLSTEDFTEFAVDQRTHHQRILCGCSGRRPHRRSLTVRRRLVPFAACSVRVCPTADGGSLSGSKSAPDRGGHARRKRFRDNGTPRLDNLLRDRTPHGSFSPRPARDSRDRHRS